MFFSLDLLEKMQLQLFHTNVTYFTADQGIGRHDLPDVGPVVHTDVAIWVGQVLLESNHCDCSFGTSTSLSSCHRESSRKRLVDVPTRGKSG